MQLYVDFEQLPYLFLVKCMYHVYIRAQRNQNWNYINNDLDLYKHHQSITNSIVINFNCNVYSKSLIIMRLTRGYFWNYRELQIQVTSI